MKNTKIGNVIRMAMNKENLRNMVGKVPAFWQTARKDGVKAAIRKVSDFVHTRSSMYEQSPDPAAAWSDAQRFFGTNGISANSYESFYEADEDFSTLKTDIKALAFYLPQFHTFPENDEWWGKGFTEWTNTRKAKPQYPSHYQPREPHKDIGYYDLSDWRTLDRQAKMIKKHGLYGLCIYHYWFSGKRLMEKPVDLLLEHPEIDLKFCLCWANENWTRTWDGMEKHVLISQKHENDDIDYIIDLKKYVMDPRYIRVNGEPLVLVYRPDSLPDAAKTFRRWRQWAMDNGIGKIRLLVVRGCMNSPASAIVEGADGEVEFPPAYTASPNVLKCTKENAQIMYYPSYVNEIISGRSCTEKFTHPVYRGAMLGWDCTPRRKAYHSWYGFSAYWYYTWLRYNIEYTRKHRPEEDRFIFINAWNEWAEGTYLEPDQMFGYANLNTTSKALFDIPLDIAGAKPAQLQLVKKSPYFVPEWYQDTYKDVKYSCMDPATHYTVAGWKEGRTPSPRFPNALYLFFNQKVRQGDTCALVDYYSKGLTDAYLKDLCDRFDALTDRTREQLKIHLLVPEKVPEKRKFKAKKVAIHLHCYYTDMLPEIYKYLSIIPFKYDLLVSLPEKNKERLEDVVTASFAEIPNLDKCIIRATPNRGRDIAPMICTFGKDLLQYDYFCHIHTKKSLHTKAHAKWAKYIYDHLFGDLEWFRRIYALLDDGAAIVYPADFLMMEEEPSGWGSNIEYAQKFLDKLGKKIDLKKDFPVIEFPQGSMFWANVSAMKEMLSLDLKYEDFPPEPLGTDGSIAHALERLFFIWSIDHSGKLYQIFREGEEEKIARKRYWYSSSNS